MVGAGGRWLDPFGAAVPQAPRAVPVAAPCAPDRLARRLRIRGVADLPSRQPLNAGSCAKEGQRMTKLKRKHYEALLEPMQAELVRMARWVQETGRRLVVLFEGRDTAGKGGAIQAIA